MSGEVKKDEVVFSKMAVGSECGGRLGRSSAAVVQTGVVERGG